MRFTVILAALAPSWGWRMEDVTAEQKKHHVAHPQDLLGDHTLVVLAHELRQPLETAGWSLGVVRQAVDATIRDRACRILERQLDMVRRLVDDLLDLSAMAHGHLSLRTEPVDLTRLVREACEDMRGEITSRGLHLGVSLPSRAVSLWGDPARLRQVLSNLLSNAARHTGLGGTIRVGLERQDDEAILRVADTGSGISAELLPRVFEPFVHQRDAHEGGFGLGLTIVRTLVALHRGDVHAVSGGPGQGAEFILRLPIHRPDPSATRPEG